MITKFDESNWKQWQQERQQLTSEQTYLLDAAAMGFYNSRKTPTTPRSIQPPRNITDWAQIYSQLTQEELTDVDVVTQALLAANKAKKAATTPPKPPPQPVPTPTDYPTHWKNERTAAINLGGPGTNEVIKVRSQYKIFIAAIILSVSNKTSITFRFGAFGLSGPMGFGDTDQPRAVVMAMGDSPVPCGEGPFHVISDGASASVGGFVVYTEEKEPPPPKKL